MERTGTELKDLKMIGLNFQIKSFLKRSVFGVYTRVLHKTLVKITNEYMGFQSALYNPTLVDSPQYPFLCLNASTARTLIAT